MSNLGYLFVAYAAVWVGLFLYLRSLSRRSRTLEREVQELEQLLRSQGAHGAPPGPRAPAERERRP